MNSLYLKFKHINPKIIAAAVIDENNNVHSLNPPMRHHNIIHKLFPIKIIEQGFLLNDGTFIDRLTAASIAIKSGQINKLNNPPELFTEDLW